MHSHSEENNPSRRAFLRTTALGAAGIAGAAGFAPRALAIPKAPDRSKVSFVTGTTAGTTHEALEPF